MAQSKKKTTTRSRASSDARASAKKAETNQNAKPMRREIGALICVFLAIFTAIGYFNDDAWFIHAFCWTARVLFGWGFYIVPPVMLLCAWILAFHRGRPVTFRLVCALLLPVAFGGFYQLFAAGKAPAITWGIFGTLIREGLVHQSGGLTGGLLAALVEHAVTKVGASAVFILGFVFLVMGSLRLTVSGIADKVRSMPKREYEPEPEPEKPAVKQPVLQQPAARKKAKVIDIPLEEAETQKPAHEPEKPQQDPEEVLVGGVKKSFFNSKPRVLTPDAVYADVPVENEPEAEAVQDAWDRDDDLEPWAQEAANVPWEEPAQQDPEPAAAEEPQKKKRSRRTVAEEIFSDEEEKAAANEPFEAPEDTAEAADDAYVFPGLELLHTESASRQPDGREETNLNKERLEATLRSFGVNSPVTNIIRGPSVTRYEIELEAGVRLNRITNLSEDIALSLGASGVRVAAIPNKVSTVGIEVPNKIVSKVFLRDIIESPEFQNAPSKLTFAIGKNISGESIVGNIAKLPHLLVAGTTGSGKSVCLNSLILSILYKARPDEVKFIMIDPKMVEFKIYNGIPHLLVPVVTEAKKAAGALQWAVYEMMKRYRLFSDTGARDLATYNALVKESGEAEPMPQMVVVIDELADLMLVAAKEVEDSICRIAGMGRAAGVHLVIATQSPRADVITGLMKANIPSRIAFKVASALESRIILDAGGSADKLVGNGDMLFVPVGTTKPNRIQGTWVSDEEREDVLNFLKAGGEAQYSDDVIRQIERAASEDKNGGSGGGKASGGSGDSDDLFSEYDEMLPQAVDVILDCGQASVSLLQRRLKLGYSRAARIVDQMEEIGVVGPFEGSKPRQILITKQAWQERQMIHGTAPTERPYVPLEDDPRLEDFDD